MVGDSFSGKRTKSHRSSIVWYCTTPPFIEAQNISCAPRYEDTKTNQVIGRCATARVWHWAQIVQRRNHSRVEHWPRSHFGDQARTFCKKQRSDKTDVSSKPSCESMTGLKKTTIFFEVGRRGAVDST
eukprot:scaffold1424_cov168-Amphora_coffeaeformis.AAC.7